MPHRLRCRDSDDESYEYYYPFTECPECGADLTGDNDVELGFSVGGNTFQVRTGLDDNGVLLDVDRLIENGYHSYACCAKCGTDLETLEMQVEEDENA